MLERVRHLDDAERRARIAPRHGIAPGLRDTDPIAAVRAMTVLHATEPATVYLSLHARVEGLGVADVDAALYRDRTLVKQLAMRRTLFVFPRDLLPAAWGSASARVAGQERARLVKDVEQAGLAADGRAWLAAATAAVRERLADGSALTAQQLRLEVPELAGRFVAAAGKAYGGEFPIGPRVLTVLGAEAAVVRGVNDGHWRVSRPRWTSMATWLGEEPVPLDPEAGYAELTRRWLATFGPGTAADLQWWLGATTTAVRRALAAADAVPVALDGGTTGWVLPDDLDPTEPVEPWAVLLPVLDPTVMGWQDRRFLLGPHGPQLFDRNGNAGTTAWWDGRIVGCWAQDEAGTVRLAQLSDVGTLGRAALEAEAARLTAWLDGVRVSTVYPSPAMKSLRGRLDVAPAPERNP